MSLFGLVTGGPLGALRGGIGRGGIGGMSPITMAVLGLIAYKALKLKTPASAGQGAPSGGLEGLLGNLGAAGAGGLTGLGGVLSGGIGDLLKQFRTAGKGEVADSWVATGPNKSIPPADLGQVLSAEQIAFLTERTGLSRDELLKGLAQQLPDTIDKLTPEGHVPTPQELERAR